MQISQARVDHLRQQFMNFGSLESDAWEWRGTVSLLEEEEEEKKNQLDIGVILNLKKNS